MSRLSSLVRDPPPPWAVVTAAVSSVFFVLFPGRLTERAASQGAMNHPHGIAASALMSVVMACLIVSPTAERLWRRNLRRYRLPASASFVLAYAGIWLVLPLIALPFSATLLSEQLGVWTVIVVVIAWQCSPVRQSALNACHRSVALRVFGAASIFDCALFGVRTGLLCFAACGPLMTVAMTVQHFPAAAMAAAFAVAVIERAAPPRQPAWGWSLRASVARELRFAWKRPGPCRIKNAPVAAAET